MELLLLQLLELHLLLVELVNGRRVYLCIVVGGSECSRLVLLNPEVLGRFEVIAEDGNDFLDLVVRILINKELKLF